MKNTEEVRLESISELKRLLKWIVENHDDWEAVCNIGLFNMYVERRLQIIEKLEEAGLFSTAYIVFCFAGDNPRDMEVVREMVTNEIYAEMPVEGLVEQIKKNMMKYIWKTQVRDDK